MAAGTAGLDAPAGTRAVMEAGREWADRLEDLCGELYQEEHGGGNGDRACMLKAAIRREKATLARARLAVHEVVALAERDASRRADLFAATYRAMSMSPMANDIDAGLAIVMVTVLLDAGRPLPIGEVARRMKGERGRYMSEASLYLARFSGAIYKDCYDVLHLSRPAGHGEAEGWGEEWMYEALERAVSLGAARYTASGIDMGGGTGGLSARELAGAAAVAAGVSAFGETPGLAEWFSGAGRGSVTWAKATVIVRAARAEVGEAWARISAGRVLAAAGAPGERAAHAHASAQAGAPRLKDYQAPAMGAPPHGGNRA